MNDSWLKALNPFATIQSSNQLFEAGRNSLGELMRAATGRPALSQDAIIALLAGPDQTSPEGQQVRQELANRMRLVLDDQRLVSLDTLLALGDGLNQMANGKGASDFLVPLAESCGNSKCQSRYSRLARGVNTPPDFTAIATRYCR